MTTDIPAYAPCQRCGLEVLTGVTDRGAVVTLDPHQRCYAVLWQNNAPQPELRLSGAYPVHCCVSPVKEAFDDR